MRKKQIEHCKNCGRKLTNKERRHTQLRYYKEPTNYVGWDDWAEKMSETHVQRECPGCGRLTMWEPK